MPSSWKWCKLGEVCIFLSRGKSPKYLDEDRQYPVFAQKCNLKEGGISLAQARFLDPMTINKWDEVYKLRTGDVLVNSTGTGTVGRTRLFNESCLGDYPFVVPDSHVSVVRTANEIVSEYIYAYMSSNVVQEYLEDNLAGSTNQKELYIGILDSLQIPLPPYVEQKRIVSEIEKWYKASEAIENGKSDLEKVIRQTKNKILELAIHGKLVPQNPTDEPAYELLKRINPKAEITCDNPQYGKLPNGWCLIQGKSLYKPMKSMKPKDSVFNYIDIDSINNAKQSIDSVKVVKTENAPSRASRYTQKGDIVFSMVRPYLKNIAIVPANDCIASTGFYVCSPSNVAISKYCYYLMISDYTVSGLNQFMKGDNSPSINRGDIDNWLFPLPPLSEQHRIVAKIEELFAQLDNITSSL